MKTTTENNRLLAEFMEFQKTNIGWYDFEETLNLPHTIDNTFDTLEFNTSWDWLMPVVEKIEELSSEQDEIVDYFQGDPDPSIWFSGYGKICMHADISKVYETLVEFINWYNNDSMCHDQFKSETHGY